MSIYKTVLTPEEESQLIQLHEEVREIIDLVGRLELRNYMNDEDIASAKVRFRGVLVKQKEIIDQLKSKYGSDAIDIVTGFVI